jgi:hypothetical protein
MALSVSPAIKVFALLGMLVALLMGGGFFVMGNEQQAVSAPLPTPAELVKRKAAKTGSNAHPPAKALPVKAKTRVARSAPVATPKAAAKATAQKATAKPNVPAKAKPKAVPRVGRDGLPLSISRALAANAVVVVSLYGANWKIDSMARDEASAGARAAHAGFVALDVTRASSAAEALMLKYDTIFRAPTVLVFRRGGELSLQLDGFRDRDTIAQAAANARQ